MPRVAARFTIVLLATPLLLLPAPGYTQSWGSLGFELRTLPSWAGTDFNTRPINNRGDVIGNALNPATGRHEAVILRPFSGGGSTFLGTLDGGMSFGESINDHGWVTGVDNGPAPDFESRGFLYDGSTMTDLGNLGGSLETFGTGINNHGWVTGVSSTGDGSHHAYLYDGSMHDLGVLPGWTYSYGIGINESGWVTGLLGNYSVASSRAFVYDGTLRALETLGGDVGEGDGINASGQVAGTSQLATGEMHAFRFTDGVGIEDLGDFGLGGSQGWGIDDTGRVVGVAGATMDDYRAVLWEGGMGFFLDAIVGGGWRFSEIDGVSTSGQYLLAKGTNAAVNGGAATYVVLRQSLPATTTPEPLSVMLLATGLVGVWAVKRRKGRA